MGLYAEEAAGVGGSGSDNIGRSGTERLCKAFRHVRHETALVALSTMGNRRHVGSIGLQKETIYDW